MISTISSQRSQELDRDVPLNAQQDQRPVEGRYHLSAFHAARLRALSNTFVERLDWKTCIDKYDRPHTLFYLDPPYWETEGYGVPFPYAEYVEMASRLRSLKGRAIVSLNDHPDIRRAFEGFHIEAVDIKYTVGGGGREAARKEVIIFSWDDAAQPAGLF